MRLRESSVVVVIVLTAIATLLHTADCSAGPFTDTLSVCLVNKTSDLEKTMLVKWIFAAIALHPEVESMAAVSNDQREALNRQFASLVQSLLTQSCVTEAREAVKYEGEGALEASFNVLGQVASRELFTDPAVAEGIAAIAKYIDADALQALTHEEVPQ
jgi:hypothetical protein